ncbi:uncharacterized protein V1513DRAFT_139014 [Lipomyces chichibuensis]|uniref:uncharacterized protein n=1 Tax=Lipomyces chichibuensis TaxID=1546026 RepID=UPI003343ABED
MTRWSSKMPTLDIRLILPTIIASLIASLENRRYLSRSHIPRHSAMIDLLLHCYKRQRRDIFRKKLRVYPETFDALVMLLRESPVFSSMTAPNAKSVETHLAILLYRLGHYGNGASNEEVASWAGVGVGTVDCITKRTLLAIFQIDLESRTVHWPTPDEREQYKQYIESMSCAEWRNGWCMIDGTLIPIFAKPHYYGDVFYDRKSNYSFNVQTMLSDCPDLDPTAGVSSR